MSHRSLVIAAGVVVAAGCAEEIPPGQISLDYTLGLPGAEVLVFSTTSDVQVHTDASGHAVLPGIAADATVYAVLFVGANRIITAISGVQPGEHLDIGTPKAELHPTIGTMAVSIATPPPVAYDSYEVVSSCGSVVDSAPTSYSMTFDNRCDTTVDVLVRAKKKVSLTSYAMVSHAFLERPFVDGGTLTIAQWSDPVSVTVERTGTIANQLLSSSLSTEGLPGDVVLVGRPLRYSEDLRIGFKGDQAVATRLAPIAMQSVNLDSLLAPYAIVTGTSWKSSTLRVDYEIDDLGGVVGAPQMLDLQINWALDSGSIGFSYRVDPATANGVVELQWPETLRNFAPVSSPFGVGVAYRFDSTVTYADAHTGQTLLPFGMASHQP
jgi:hypothetical protein